MRKHLSDVQAGSSSKQRPALHVSEMTPRRVVTQTNLCPTLPLATEQQIGCCALPRSHGGRQGRQKRGEAALLAADFLAARPTAVTVRSAGGFRILEHEGPRRGGGTGRLPASGRQPPRRSLLCDGAR